MADTYYKLATTPNRHTDWTTNVILERDEDGNVTKEVGVNQPAQLNETDRNKVEALGYTLERVSKQEAEESQAAQAAGTDVTGAAPVFGDAERPNQAPARGSAGDDDKK